MGEGGIFFSKATVFILGKRASFMFFIACRYERLSGGGGFGSVAGAGARVFDWSRISDISSHSKKFVTVFIKLSVYLEKLV